MNAARSPIVSSLPSAASGAPIQMMAKSAPPPANAINGEKLKNKLQDYKNIQYKENIFEAIKSIPIRKNDLVLITGSLYLAGEILNLN